MSKRKTQTYDFDRVLLGIVIVLLVYGFMSLFSATFYVGDFLWQRQLLWIGIALVVGFALFRIPYPIWQKMALLLMAVNLLGLLVTVLFAGETLGARRGLVDLSSGVGPRGLFGIGSSVQPGVTARLVAVIYMATWLASKGDQLNKVMYGLVPFAAIIGAVAGMVVAQKDLSTALLIAVTGIAMFFFAGGDPIQIFLFVILAGGAFALVAWNMPHGQERLGPYIQSFSDPDKTAYQILQSMRAISQGGVWGEGLGQGRMKFGYLPVPWTDSIFAVIGEEGGLIGCVLVLALFGLFAYRGYRVTLSTPDAFGSLTAFGITTMVVTEALMNVLVMIGLFPPTGTALPFFSYGGTQMVMTLAAVGLLLGVSRGRPKGDWDAVLDRWWRDGRARLSRSGRRSSFTRHRA